MKLLPVAVLGYLCVALVWPTWRTWRRTRVFPVVFHREAETAQRVLGALLGLFLAGLASGACSVPRWNRSAYASGSWPRSGMRSAGFSFSAGSPSL